MGEVPLARREGHIVNGGSPRELRVTLDDRPRQCEQGIVELMQLQVEDGGTVAVTGPTDDVVFTSLDTDADFKGTCEHHHDADSKMIAVICKEKDETRAVPCRDRYTKSKWWQSARVPGMKSFSHGCQEGHSGPSCFRTPKAPPESGPTLLVSTLNPKP